MGQQQTLLIGGPGHLQAVPDSTDAVSHDWADGSTVHRYRRRTWMDDSGQIVRAFYVHPDLSDGEAQALIRMQMHPG